MKQKAYCDIWSDGMGQYLRMLTLRLLLMRDLLAPDGCIWVHLDWHAVHYAKVLMDELFGEKNFINEIVWTYKSGGVSTRHFARKHDTLLYYAKGKEYFFSPQKEKSYNRGFRPYRFKGVEEFQDEVGWYTLVNKKDVWQIDMVGRTSGERTGYATQKPEALIQQILESCTREGDLCADFFCGSGTLPAVASRMGRRFLCCDSGALAAAGTKGRLARAGSDFSCYYEGGAEAGKKVFAGRGVPELSAELQRDCEAGQTRLQLALTGYRLPKLSQLSIGREQLAEVRKLVKKDPLALVDFWSADLHYDGKMYRPELFFFREKDKLKGRIEISDAECRFGDEDFAAAAVWVCDVFGNSGFVQKELCLKEMGE